MPAFVAAQTHGGLGQVVGAEREEFRRFGEFGGAQRRARQFDHVPIM